MFCHEPGLEFIAAYDIRDEQVVGPVIAEFLDSGRHFVGLDKDQLVRLQKPRQHGGNLFHSVRGTRHGGDLGDVARVAHSHSSQRLDPLRDGVDKAKLFAGVLVQQEMELVEGRSPHEPMVLLVEIVQDSTVRQNLVQALAGVLSCIR